MRIEAGIRRQSGKMLSVTMSTSFKSDFLTSLARFLRRCAIIGCCTGGPDEWPFDGASNGDRGNCFWSTQWLSSSRAIDRKQVAHTRLAGGHGHSDRKNVGTAGRGELAAMILWPLFVASVITLGVPSSLIYHLRSRAGERRNLVGSGFAMAAIIGLPGCGRCFPNPALVAEAIFARDHPCRAMVLDHSSAVFGHARRPGRSGGRARFCGLNAIQILTPLATLAALLLVLWIRLMNPCTAAVAYVLASLPTFCLMLLRVRRAGIRMSPGFNCGHAADIAIRRPIVWDRCAGNSRPASGSGVCGGPLSAGAMGSYVVVLSLSRMLNFFQTSVVMVLFPKAAGHNAKKVLAMTGESVRISGLVTVACGAMVCLAGPTLLRVVYGAEYEAAAGALRILILEAVLSGITFVLAQAFMALNRPGVVTVCRESASP